MLMNLWFFIGFVAALIYVFQDRVKKEKDILHFDVLVNAAFYTAAGLVGLWFCLERFKLLGDAMQLTVKLGAWAKKTLADARQNFGKGQREGE